LEEGGSGQHGGFFGSEGRGDGVGGVGARVGGVEQVEGCNEVNADESECRVWVWGRVGAWLRFESHGDALIGRENLDGKWSAGVAYGEQVWKSEGRIGPRHGDQTFSREACCEPFEVRGDGAVGESDGEEGGYACGNDEDEQRVKPRRASPMADADGADEVEENSGTVHADAGSGGFETHVNALGI
jgi:hypothetical protein